MTTRAGFAPCTFPADAALERRFVDHAWYQEAYRVDLGRTELGPCELFLAVFAHHPAWMNAALMLRIKLGPWIGLRASPREYIVAPLQAGPFDVGSRIGRWPIHALDADQVVAGTDDRHLDFRVVVRRDLASLPPNVTVATVCVAHNLFGKLYLLLVLPLHRWGMRLLLENAQSRLQQEAR